MKFFVNDFFSKYEEILNGKIHYLYSIRVKFIWFPEAYLEHYQTFMMQIFFK